MKFNNKKGKLIGEYADGIFTKSVVGSKHKLRDPEGWAIDTEVVNTLSILGCDVIQVTDKESKVTYTAKFETFKDYAIPISRGYGDQLVLPVRYWITHPN